MLKKLLDAFKVPETDLERASSVFAFLIQVGIVVASLLVVIALAWMGKYAGQWMLVASILLVAMLGLRWLNQHGYTSLAIDLFLVVVTLYAASIRPLGFPVVEFDLLIYTASISIASLLLSPMAGLIWGGVVTSTILAQSLMVAADRLAGYSVPYLGIVGFNVIALLMWLFGRSFRQTAADLRRRIRQGQASIEIGRTVTGSLDVPSVVSRAVQLIRDVFDYYQVGLFLVNSENDTASLVDVAGEAAASLKERDFHVSLTGATAVAAAINHGRRWEVVTWEDSVDSTGRVVEFTYDRLPTRVELVIPIQARNRVLGALDLHSTQLGRFSEEDIHTLEGLVGHIANTLESAQLLDDIRQRHQELEEVYEQTERRARYLETTAELARAISSLYDIQKLLDKAVVLISEGLNAYHAGVFLVDETGSWAVLTAASSEGGKRMLARGHKLRVGQQGIVGWVTDTGQPRIALDVGEDAVYFDNPDLPDTRSEVALPLRVGGWVIGVVDVQSEHESAFSDEDMSVLQVLGDQIAVAIENVRLFQQTQQALEEVQSLQRYYVAQEWERLSSQRSDLSAEYRSIGVSSFETVGAPEMDAVLTQESPVALSDLSSISLGGDGKGETGEDRGALPARSVLAVPIKLRDEVIGVLDLQEMDEERQWTDEEIEMTNAVADQLGLALENARLFEESRSRAEELAVLNELSRALTARLSVEQVLEETYRGASRLMRTSNFYVGLYDPERHEIEFAFDVSESEIDSGYTTISADEGIAGYIVRTRESLLMQGDVAERQKELGIDIVGEPSASWLGVPLLIGDQILGVMAVQDFHTPEAYTEHDRDLMTAIASQTAIALQNARLFEDIESRLAQLTALQETISAVAGTLELDRLLDLITQQATTLFQGDGGIINLVDWEKMEDEVVAASGSQAHTFGSRHPLTDGLSGWVALNNQPVIANQLQDDSRAASEYRSGEAQGQNAAIVPLIVNDQVVGTLVVMDKQGGKEEFDQADLDLLTSFADQAAIALQNARLFEEAQRRATQLATAADVARDATAILDVDQLLDATVHLISERFGFYHAGVFLLDEWDRYAVLQAASSEGGQLMLKRGHRLKVGETGIVGRVASTGESRVTLDVSEDSEHFAHADLPDTRSEMALPLKVRGQVIGVLDVQSTQPAAFSEDDVAVLQTMADQLATAIANARLFQDARTEARRRALINEVLQAASASLNPEELLHQAGEVISRRLEVSSGVFTWEPDEQVLSLVALHAADASDVSVPEESRRITYEMDPLLVGVVRERRTRLLEATDVSTDSDAVGQAHGQSAIYVPLVSRDRALGVLTFGGLEEQPLMEVEFAELVAANLSVALENARLYQDAVHTAEQLAEADRLKSQFLANMSHELRTPLNSIIGFSRVILKEIDGPLTDMQRTDLQAVYDSGQHLLGLINDILDISKIEAGKMELAFEMVNLGQVIEGVVATAKGMLKSKPNVKLQQSVPEDLPLIRGDERRIRQALLNLISNAEKFTEEGFIRIEAVASSSDVTLSVTDSGMGIPTDKIDAIFEPFIQADASTTRRVGGTGLGLSITSSFVEMHGGRMWVESEAGRGSTFYIELPIEGPPMPSDETEVAMERAEPGPAPKPESVIGQKTVLCVEDDEGVITLFRRYLSKHGYRVVGLTDSTMVVEQARALNPFAITLDVMMPDKDGWQIIQELKSAPETRHIPVVMCTIVGEKKRGLSLGASDYLVKPILEDDLIAALERLDGDDGRHLVLVVDDRQEDRELLRRMIESCEGYDVVEASGGQEAIALIQHTPPHLIILDLMMPDVDGFDVLEMVKSNRDTRSIPIVVVTAKDLTQGERDFLHSGVEALLQKGLFEQQELLEDVAAALERLSHEESE